MCYGAVFQAAIAGSMPAKFSRRPIVNRLRKSIAALAISGAALGACAVGSALIYGAVAAPQHHAVTPEQMATANDLSSVFRNVGKMIEPSVVNITVHKTVKRVSSTPNGDLRHFFK